MDTRNLVVGLLVALAVYLFYANVIWPAIAPKPPAPVSIDHDTPPAPPRPDGAALGPQLTAGPAGPQLTIAASDSRATVTLGGRELDALRLSLTPVGAAVESLELVARDARGRFLYRRTADTEDPVTLLRPVSNGQRTFYSLGASRIGVVEPYQSSWPLDSVAWHTVSTSAGEAVFSTRLVSSDDGAEVLRLSRRFALVEGKSLVIVTTSVQNVGAQPLNIFLTFDGPIGIYREHVQFDMRMLMAAAHTNDGIELSRAYKWDELRKATLAGDPPRLFVGDSQRQLAWVALGNKFFGVFARPLLAAGQPSFIQGATARVLQPDPPEPLGDTLSRGDLLARLTTRPAPLDPGASLEYTFEVYAGPKDADELKRINPSFADASQLGYNRFHGADIRCFCVPLWLMEFMSWSLASIKGLVSNGGVAIIILVIIIRILLHPLTVFQQKSMYRMQDAMGRIQPKMAAVREKYAGDQARINQEIMKVYSEEGVNPAAPLVGMLPMLLQMPILAAMWVALSTDIHLRHAPLDGWWIRDLSAPDALVSFSPPIDIPVLSWIPFLGFMFKGVSALNVLPVLMGISMYLQQKYMPKPKLPPAPPPAPDGKRPPGLTPQDQLRQQQMIGYMMTFMFPVMFYYMPSGLNLYWMATNVFGICESLMVRRQLEREKELRAMGAPVPAKRGPGPVARFFRRLADQAGEVQRKADALSGTERPGRKRRSDKSN